MYRTVIVPLDGSELAERAIGPAAEVARITGADLVPLMVVSDGPSKRQEHYLEKQVEGLGVSTPTPFLIVDDDAAEAIANAGESPDSLLVMTTHGAGGIRRAVLGSVAEKVLHRLPRPMLLVGPGFTPGQPLAGGKVLLPVDGSHPSEAIFPLAADWCRTFDLEPWVVTVNPTGGGTAHGLDRGDITEGNAAHRVAADMTRLGVTAGWEVLHGDSPGEAVITFALDLPASVIAMTTHGRTGLARLTTGSTAAGVLHGAACPVLVLRPSNLADD